MNDIPEQDRVRLRPPPSTIDIQFGQPWSVVTPAVYRYEDQKWIDLFFDTGQLRLSTFSKFATYADEHRGDVQEGRAICYGETGDGGSVFLVQAQGISAAVFCCSHRLDRDLIEAFGRNSVFQITNTFGFAVEIARQLPGFRHGLEGTCIYRSDTTIKRPIDFDPEKYRQPDGNVDMRMMPDLGGALGGAELVLLKRKKYEGQQEYRLLWELDAIKGEHIDVIAPNARKFCRKVGPAEWSD